MAYKTRRHLVLCEISDCRTALLKFLKIIHMARGLWAHAKPRRLLFISPFARVNAQSNGIVLDREAWHAAALRFF